MAQKKNDVIIAEMSKDIKYIIEKVEDQNNKYDKFCEKTDERIKTVETISALNKQNLETVGTDINYLKKESRAWNIINSAAAGICAIFGIGVARG